MKIPGRHALPGVVVKQVVDEGRRDWEQVRGGGGNVSGTTFFGSQFKIFCKNTQTIYFTIDFPKKHLDSIFWPCEVARLHHTPALVGGGCGLSPRRGHKG
jgi:hypothetical protein